MEVHVTGMEPLLELFKRGGVQVERQIGQGMLRLALVLRDQIQLELSRGHSPTTLGVVSGDLRRKWVAQMAGPLASVVGTRTPYARIHEFGGVIRAKNAPYLVFKLRDGTFRSVKSVTMPARPYVAPAIRNADPRIKAETNAIVGRIVGKGLGIL